MMVSVKKSFLKAFNFYKCLFGLHSWEDETLTFRRCEHCGYTQIREYMPPDGDLTHWKSNYR